MQGLGLLHIYHGNGKGKTTAALGLALRCAGRGGRVLIAQFLKGQPSGELKTLALIPNIKILRAKEATKFTFQMTPEELVAVKERHSALLKEIAKELQEGNIDLLILDEALGALQTGLLDKEELLDLLDTRPQETEAVLTGRDPSPQLLERADYVSEIVKRKHPFDKGVPARIGIER